MEPKSGLTVERQSELALSKTTQSEIFYSAIARTQVSPASQNAENNHHRIIQNMPQNLFISQRLNDIQELNHMMKELTKKIDLMLNIISAFVAKVS